MEDTQTTKGRKMHTTEDDPGSRRPPRQQAGGLGNREFGKKTPEEVKENVKRVVGSGVAAAAGAVEGFNEQMEENHIPEQAAKAVEQAGRTTKEIARTVREQGTEVKNAIQGHSSPGGRDKSGGAGSDTSGLGSQWKTGQSESGKSGSLYGQSGNYGTGIDAKKDKDKSKLGQSGM